MSHVTVIGLGNIGSHLVPLLGRLPGVDRVTLIDKDRYEPKNLAGQDIDRGAVGKSKAAVQARRLRRINPALTVEAVAQPVEDLPLGTLRADLILACLDSGRARQAVNQAAWRLGIPWIDSGVRSAGRLARVNAYDPACVDAPCLECAWSQENYAALDAAHPCNPVAAAPTDAPAALGALAASLQALEAEKLLAGRTAEVLFGREVVVDAARHGHWLSSLRRNPQCRFDHAVWRVETLEPGFERRPLREAFRLRAGNGSGAAWLSVEGKPFVTRLGCARCDSAAPAYRLRPSIGPRHQSCRVCGGDRTYSGWDLAERLTAHLPRQVQSRSLRSLGLRPGEVFAVGDDAGEAHFEIGRG